MSYFWIGTVPCFLVYFFIAFCANKTDTHKKELRCSRGVLLVGLFGAFLIVGAGVNAIIDNQASAGILFFCVAIGPIFILWSYFRTRLSYTKENFTVRRKTYSYNDITKVRITRETNEYDIYYCGKIIGIGRLVVNGGEFLKFLKRLKKKKVIQADFEYVSSNIFKRFRERKKKASTKEKDDLK